VDISQSFNRALLTQLDNLSEEERQWIFQCRRDINQLGFCYQLIFVKVFNRFPRQEPLEIVEDILTFASFQLGISSERINEYQKRRPTLSEHQKRLIELLQMKKFENIDMLSFEEFLFQEALRFDQTSLLFSRAQQFLKEQSILQPGESILRRVVSKQKELSSKFVFSKIEKMLSGKTKKFLDNFLVAEKNNLSPFHKLKEPPVTPSTKGLIVLAKKVELILEAELLKLDLSWLHANYQRHMAKYALRCTADRIRALQKGHRYTVMVCFLAQTYQETLDQIVDMFFKLMTRIANQIQRELQELLLEKRKAFKESLFLFRALGHILLDDTVPEKDLKKTLFKKVKKEDIQSALERCEPFLVSDQFYAFSLMLKRFSYLRQFSPCLLKILPLETLTPKQKKLLHAVTILKQLNQEGKRKIPNTVTLDFLPKSLHGHIKKDNTIYRNAYECAVLMQLKKEVRTGNIIVKGSKRFCDLDTFFMPYKDWADYRNVFFQKAQLPVNPFDVEPIFKELLKTAYKKFVDGYPDNHFARIEDEKLILSTDDTEALSEEESKALDKLRSWLSSSMRQIKLPDLLIEIDNDLKFTKVFTQENKSRHPEEVCAILAAIMAHGCFIGSYTMARMTGVSYEILRRITDWQLTEDGQRLALACLVNSIANLDITAYWGKGVTSSSDGQGFLFTRNSLSKTFSHCFFDYALEFYTFVADNYAPFFSMPIECVDRDASFVLDGLIYNESDLVLQEHYTDTHGYTEINFTAFAMMGKKFSPRIKGVQRQRLYRCDDQQETDCGDLWPLVSSKKHVIRFEPIIEQWDRIGHFYASLERGYTTASTALKRLIAFNENNQFCKANRELGRLLKTECILDYLSNPSFRKRQRKGLLKGEQIHQLARHVAYGKQGKINARDFYEQKNTCSCLTLIMACIIYWQAKEIKHLIEEKGQELDSLCLKMVPYISPIGWDNVVLYGEYVLNKNLVR